MKITGDLDIEGITLHVAIEAPDDTKELFVANVHPNCLVVPKDRWKIEFLGLSSETVAELHQNDIFTLDQLINGTAIMGADGLGEDMRDEIRAAVETFFDIALTFDQPTRLFAALTPHGGNGSRPDGFQTDIAAVGLLTEQERALRKSRNAHTYGDLVRLGKNRLMMTGQMDERGMQKLEDALRRVGIELPD